MRTNELYRLYEIQLVWKPLVRHSQRPVIHSSVDVIKILLDYVEIETLGLYERVIGIFLSNTNKLLGLRTFHLGANAMAIVDPNLICKYALKGNARGLILCHNHPSGNANPSGGDVQTTNKIKDALGLIDVKLMDHIIFTDEANNFFSFCDEGFLPETNKSNL